MFQFNVIPMELFKAAIHLRHRLVDDPQPAREADVIVLRTLSLVCRRWRECLRDSDDLKRLRRIFHR